ncbi:MAG: glycosyltransferase [Oscillospiraceae bacterium]|nr:glycosyltransferase [Oscillospiraceae bacterium]
MSIVVPVYNAAPHLARCIQSLRTQTYKNLEIILVNDGSHDTSLTLCHVYARIDSRILILDRHNSGVSATRNAGIAVATGDYLQFVDSDDYLPPNATQLMVEKALDVDADLIIAPYYRVVNDKITLHNFILDERPMDTVQFAKNLMDEPASFYYGVLWNKLYRRSLIAENNIQCSEELQWSEDFLFNLEYIRVAQRFCAIQCPVYYYVKNKTSLTATAINPINVMQIKKSLFEYYKDLYINLGLYDAYKAKIYKYIVASAEHR